MKIGRNDRCHCGSGKKFKRCHGAFGPDPRLQAVPFVSHQLRRHEADEAIRQKQQGLGRPIVSTRHQDHQIVAVGKKLFWSRKWKTVPDFLADYIKTTLDPAWGNAEIKKPLAERHPILQWYDKYCRYQAVTITTPGEVSGADVTGVVSCYLGLAYSLYLLAHNVELQARLVRRLKDPTQFQGAYYELIVANALIRAGFKLTLEDETDGTSKHCEFAAISKATGKRYWVEAKMRAVAGMLGRTERDGGGDTDPLSRLTKHISAALAKPAHDERLIFVDLNAPFEPVLGAKQPWVKPANAALERYERHHPNAKAYVVVTNVPFHRMLDSVAPIMAMPYGLGMPDFNRPGFYQLSQEHLNKMKHIDAYNLCDAFGEYTAFPVTFDGSLPSEAFGRTPPRIRVGETYQFTDVDDITGTVAQVIVDETTQEAVLGVNTHDGRFCLLREKMTDEAFAEYKAYPDTYFGIQHQKASTQKVNNRMELFTFFMHAYRTTPRQKIEEWMQPHFKPGELAQFDEEHLRALYCEGMVAVSPMKFDD